MAILFGGWVCVGIVGVLAIIAGASGVVSSRAFVGVITVLIGSGLFVAAIMGMINSTGGMQ